MEGSSLCPLCKRRAPDTQMKFKLATDKRYNTGGYYEWNTRRVEVPVCTTCRKWWRLANPVLTVLPAFIILAAVAWLNKSESTPVYIVGTVIFFILGGGGSTAYLVRGLRIRKWLKAHMPELRFSGIPE